MYFLRSRLSRASFDGRCWKQDDTLIVFDRVRMLCRETTAVCTDRGVRMSVAIGALVDKLHCARRLFMTVVPDEKAVLRRWVYAKNQTPSEVDSNDIESSWPKIGDEAVKCAVPCPLEALVWSDLHGDLSDAKIKGDGRVAHHQHRSVLRHSNRLGRRERSEVDCDRYLGSVCSGGRAERESDSDNEVVREAE
jgi:hypothetical protein